MSNIANQLYVDALTGVIDKDDLLKVCLTRLQELSSDELYDMALDEGFIVTNYSGSTEERVYEQEVFKGLDATQRIIEKILNRHGE
tara:strand:- start:520 stop:777 length:258 start_codon:yes stop_codon:yes gene_type:complete